MQDDFDTLRPLCYPQTNVFLLCFSVVCPTSFHNIQEKWLPEIRRNGNKAPVILVGTQCDLRHDVKVLIELAQCHEQPVNGEVARRVANKIGAIKYVECSALTQKNLKVRINSYFFKIRLNLKYKTGIDSEIIVLLAYIPELYFYLKIVLKNN